MRADRGIDAVQCCAARKTCDVGTTCVFTDNSHHNAQPTKDIFLLTMDEDIATFLAFTSTEDSEQARRFLDISGGNVEYAVQLFLESNTNEAPPRTAGADEELAHKLQQEAYQNNDVREADENVHRHDTLLGDFNPYGMGMGMGLGVNNDAAIFGSGRVGVFNQRYDDEYPDEYDDESSDDNIIEIGLGDDEDEDGVMEIDHDGQPVERLNRRSQAHRNRLDDLSSTQRRLAELFKPPFDLIVRKDLDSAKILGREQKKWLLVNIQDPSEFQCQVLNRDFWSNPKIKEVIRENFLLLQYQRDSPHGSTYLNFYTLDSCPHISILDPMTGERVFSWTDGVVPDVDEWIADVQIFLEKFSLLPTSSNPMVEHEVKFDPDALTEEQQLEYAMKQSMGEAPAKVDGNSENIADTEIGGSDANSNPLGKLHAKTHKEPDTGPSTRVQFRFPNGKRLIHKFSPEDDTVADIYQWLKFVFQNEEDLAYGIPPNEGFNISCPGQPKLTECLDQTIKNAGLSNASILVERF